MKSAEGKDSSESELPFEEALEKLESIVLRLEGGGTTLEDSLTDYARAISLMQVCHKRLESVERRITVLSGVDAEGNPISKPFEEDAKEETLEDKRKRRSTRRSSAPKSHDTEQGLF